VQLGPQHAAFKQLRARAMRQEVPHWPFTGFMRRARKHALPPVALIACTAVMLTACMPRGCHHALLVHAANLLP
jgi:hypothetical protein